MKNILTFESFVAVNESFDLILESGSDTYKKLLSVNSDLMRSVFNQLVSSGYKITPTTEFNELSPKDAFKLKDDDIIKIWTKGGKIEIITLDNSVMRRHLSKMTNKDLGSRMIPYFYTSSFFGSADAYQYIKENGPKYKEFLLGCDLVYTAKLSDLTSKKTDPNNNIEKYAKKWNIPVINVIEDTSIDPSTAITNTTTPAFIIGGKVPTNHSRDYIKTGDPSRKEITEKQIINLMRMFVQKIPMDRAKDTRVIMHKQGNVITYDIHVSYQDAYSRTKLVPNAALINSIIADSGLLPSESFISEYFFTLKFAYAESEKAAKMSVSDTWTAFNNSHINNAFERALKDAAPIVKAKVREVGNQTLLLWKGGLADKPEFQSFFNDILMYYTKAEDLPGEQLKFAEKYTSKSIFQ